MISLSALGDDDLAQTIQEMVSHPYNCEGSDLNNCPAFLEERVSDFTDDRYVSDVPYQVCLKKEEFSLGEFFNEVTAADLDFFYNDNNILFNGGEYKNFGDACLKKVDEPEKNLKRLSNNLTDFDERQNMTQEKCEEIKAVRARSRCLRNIRFARERYIDRSLSDNIEKVKVADNYLSHLKLRTGIEESMRSVNLIDLLINPEKTMNSVECEQSPYPQSKELCNRLKTDQCSHKARAASLRAKHIELTKNSLLQIRSLNLRKKELKEEVYQNFRGGRGQSLEKRYPEKFKELESIEQKVALYSSQAPWIAGEKFKELLDFSNDGDKAKLEQLFSSGDEDKFNKLLAEAFDAQMLDNKENLSGQIKDFNKASLCLKGEGECELKEINDIIDRAPKIGINDLDIPHKKPLLFAQCLSDEAKKSNDQADLVKEISIGVGLTVASIFVPPLGIARVAQLGSTAIKGVGTIARLRAGGQLASAGTVVGGDIYYASESFEQAYNQCTNDTENKVSFEGSSANSSQADLSCQIENIKLSQRIEHVPTECVSSLLFAGVDAIPFAAFATSQALRTARRGNGSHSGPQAGGGRTPATASGAGNPTRYNEVTSSIGNVDTGAELIRFKQAFNDDVLKRVGLDGLQNYDNADEIKAYRNILERFLEPGQGFMKDGEVNPDLLKRINEARSVRGLDPLSAQETASLKEVGDRWDATRDAFGTERVKLADLRSQALKRELGEMDLPAEQMRDVNCEKLSRLSPGFSTKGQSCFSFRTGDPQPEKMRGQFCSCGSYNTATNWLIRCPKNQNEFLRASNYYDQLGLFKNETLNCFRVNIPNNTTCFAGAAGPRRGGLGGMSQIFCPNRIQGDFKVDWNKMSPEEIRAKIASSRELWSDLGVPDDWVLRSPDPNALSGNGRADAVGASFRDYMVDWSPNPQDPYMAKWIDNARDCVKQNYTRGPCDVAAMSEDYEEVLEVFADYGKHGTDRPFWKIREDSKVSEEEFESFRTYTCQYLFRSDEGNCSGVQFVKFRPNAVNFEPPK